MATGDSIVGICNLGLIALGQDPITALTDNRKAAILCNARYDQVRREILRAHPWSFAIKEAQLAAASPQPAFGHGTAFSLPSDFIRVASLPGSDNRQKWSVRGRLLITDQASAGGALNLLYVYDCQDVSLFDPLFVAALGYAMAVELAEPLTQSQSKKQANGAQLEGKLSAARLVTSQDASPEEYDIDILLRSRF